MKLNPVLLPHFLPSFARTRDGQADTKILVVGDSVSAGNGSTLDSTYKQEGAWPSRIQLGNAYGIQCRPSLGAYPLSTDNRFTLTGGWAGYGGLGLAYSSSFYSPSAGTLVYDGGKPNYTNGEYDTFDIYYYRDGTGGGGVFSAQATGGASSGNINTVGTSGVQKVTVSAAAVANNNTVTITWVSGQPFIFAIDARNSSKSIVRVLNGGIQDSAATKTGNGGWLTSTGNGGGLQMIAAIAPDLTLLALGGNDAYIVHSTKADFKAAMATIIGTAKASGDVVLLTAPPAQDDLVETYQGAYHAAIQELGVELGCNVLDIWGRWGGVWDTAKMADAYHPNNTGYWDMGAAVSAALSEVLGGN